MRRVSETAKVWATIMVYLFSLEISLEAPQQVGGATSISGMMITGGAVPSEGNIQVVVDGVWGFVCDDDFGFPEADLICQNFRYEGAERFTRNNYFGVNTPELRRGSTRFWMDRVNCSVNDVSFKDCPSSGLGVHDCGPTEIAGVVCRTDRSVCELEEFPCVGSSLCIPRDQVCDGTSHCPDNSDEEACEDVAVIRLISNTKVKALPGAAFGTVLIKHQQKWGSVCDDNFRKNDSKVLCRNLGYEGGWAVPYLYAYLGEGPGTILIDSANCSGDELWIGECPNADFGEHDCSPYEDAGVFCSYGATRVRLTGGSSPESGYLELQLGGEWGGVCGSGFDDFDAQVACRFLGYNGDAMASRVSRNGSGTNWPIQLDCLGNEKTFEECRVRIINNTTCPLTDTAFVICLNSSGQLDDELQALLPRECGVPEDSSNLFLTNFAKIRGGKMASRFDAPWLASLRYFPKVSGGLKCSAVIISEDYLLTAAHCVDTENRLHFVVRVGDYNSNFVEDSEQEFSVEKVWTHEFFYESVVLDNDIALLKVARKGGRGFRFGPRVKPVCMPRFLDSYDDLKSCKVFGWGTQRENGDEEIRPNEITVNLVSEEVCEQLIQGLHNLTSSRVCSDGPLRGETTCKGDSGGPLTCLVQGRHTLYGIVSAGPPCRSPLHGADEYTRVTKFIRWILQKMLSENPS